MSIVFGIVQVGSSAAETLTVINTGTYDLEIDSVRPYGGEFAVSPDGASTIPPLDSLNYTVTFSPTIAGLHTGGIVFFSNAESAPDTVSASGTAHFVSISTVFSGWNMVSLPVTVTDRRKATVFPTSNSNAFAYSGSGYVPRDTLQYGEGYWLKFPSAQAVTVNGEDRSEDTVIVSAGWNIIGSISYPVAVDNITQVPSGLVVSPYFGYTPTGYTAADTVHAMKGYWIKATQDGILILVRP
jgi:hypothetical protein